MKREAVDRVKKGCKRCGSQDVAWHQSERGKWYLIEVFTDPRDGGAVGSYRDFHSAYCGKPEEHNVMQERITLDYQQEQDEHAAAIRQREMDRLNDEAEKLRVFANLGAADRVDFMNAIQKKIDNERANWISMDYFTDAMRQRREIESMEADLAMYEDFNADLEED